MKLSVKGMAITMAAVWGGCILATGLANLWAPRYGRRFLQLMSSVYPGYHATRELRDVVVGSLYAATDGAAGGALMAAIYNAVSVPASREAVRTAGQG